MPISNPKTSVGKSLRLLWTQSATASAQIIYSFLKVIKRLYEIGKPFAMLINFQGIFDSKERFKMFRENRVEMLWLSPRVSYIRGDGKPEKRAPFQSGYLCSGICKRQLEFAYVEKV